MLGGGVIVQRFGDLSKRHRSNESVLRERTHYFPSPRGDLSVASKNPWTESLR